MNLRTMKLRTIFAGSILAATALLAACSGGGGRESVTLEQYFQRVQTLHEEQERSSEALGEQFAEQFSGIESLEQALVAMQTVLPEFLPGFRSIIEQTQAGLASLEPPAEVQDVHADLIDVYNDFVALIDETLDQIEQGVAGEEVLQTFMGDRADTALGMRFTAIANELLAIAEAAGITVDLSTGALVAESSVPVGAPVMSGVGPGLSVAEALASDLLGPLLVNGFIVIRDGETRLCELLLESFPAQCGGASLTVEGYDPSSGRSLNEESGVMWSGGPMQLLGTIEGDHLVIDRRSRG